MPRVDHPLEQWFDQSDLRLGTAHQLNERGTYSDHPCAQCGEYYVQKRAPIGFHAKERAMNKNTMQCKKRSHGGKSPKK